MTKSAFLTPEIAAQAIGIIRPGIEALIKTCDGRMVVYIVILDPVAALDKRFEVIWEGAIGDQDSRKWPRAYNQYAHKKTRVTFETRLPSHLARFHAPHMYQEGDFKFGGSEIREGIIVGASGLAWHLDYAVSASVAATCHALCIGAFETDKSPLFVGLT